MKAPKPLWDLINNYWQANKDKKVKEEWGMGNVYTNNWAAPTYMVSVENQGLRGGGMGMKNQIWEAAKPTIEQWTGMKLQPSSLYGVRVYTEGAILAPHVDRLPLVSSCIINVDQDVDEPWLLEVYDRHDRAVNVTMEVSYRDKHRFAESSRAMGSTMNTEKPKEHHLLLSSHSPVIWSSTRAEVYCMGGHLL